MTTVFISGHRDLTEMEFVEHYYPELRRYVLEGAKFIVGDCIGADAMAQQVLKYTAREVTVYHMFDSPRINNCCYPTKGGFRTDEERDAAMTNDSDVDLAWVRPGCKRGGTVKNLKRKAKS